jgi:pantoate--beta-alanine ligase
MVRYATADEMKIAIQAARKQGFRIGLVPVSGHLEAEHLELVRQARLENERVIVGIFKPAATSGCPDPAGLGTAGGDGAAQDMVIAQQGCADWVFTPEDQDMDTRDAMAWMMEICRPDRVYRRGDSDRL